MTESDFGERGRRRRGANACARCGDRLFEKGGRMGTITAQNEATLGAEERAESFALCVDCAYSFQDWLLDGGNL